jgi:hypothetical protein
MADLLSGINGPASGEHQIMQPHRCCFDPRPREGGDMSPPL